MNPTWQQILALWVWEAIIAGDTKRAARIVRTWRKVETIPC